MPAEITRRTTIGERVFIGPGVSFLNEASFDRRSRSHPETVLEDRCTVSDHAILYPGVCIGCRAGMVVKKNVPSNVCASGNPVRIGKMGRTVQSFFLTLHSPEACAGYHSMERFVSNTGE